MGSDPYLKVTLGDFKYDDRKNAVDDMVNCPFYKMIEMDAELPGSSQLIIDVMDKDTVGSDDLIGRTIIDLEDRWFDKHWQKLGEENMVSGPGADEGTDGDQTQATNNARWKTKPLEKRTLFVDGNNSVRGTLEVWVDIMNPPTAIAFPPDDVSLPPTQTFQLHVVIWNAKDVPAMDSLENMSDLFVKCWPEGSDPQTTDTHWRAKKGKASWNYRLLFDVELGHNTRAHKFPYLHIQMWDKDILKYNDCVGESIFDMKKHYTKAFKKNVAVNIFEKRKGAALARKRKARQNLKNAIPDKKLDVVEEEYYPGVIVDIYDNGSYAVQFEGEQEPEVQIPENMIKSQEEVPKKAYIVGEKVVRLANPGNVGSVRKVHGSVEKNNLKYDIDYEDKSKEYKVEDQYIKPLVVKPVKLKVGNKVTARSPRKEQLTREGGRPKSLSIGSRGTKSPMAKRRVGGGGDGDSDDEDEGAVGMTKSSSSSPAKYSSAAKEEPADETDGEGGKQEDEEKKNANEDQESKDLINSFKSMTGLWGDVDPPDSQWLKLSVTDKNTGETTPKGEVCYSIQIWPKDKALVMPVGAARSEPNTNPYLPPPVGRLKWSWNPFVLGSELCGPVLCAQFFCCLLSIAFCLLMVFCQPFLTLMINLIFLG